MRFLQCLQITHTVVVVLQLILLTLFFVHGCVPTSNGGRLIYLVTLDRSLSIPVAVLEKSEGRTIFVHMKQTRPLKKDRFLGA